MANLLTKDEILHETLQTLVRGYGRAAVSHALENLTHAPAFKESPRGKRVQVENEKPEAVDYVDSMMPFPNSDLIRRFAEEYDRGAALPKSADIKRFFIENRIAADSPKSRNQAFRQILPVLRRMSDKGLLRLLSRSQYSGPAKLDEISEAIRGAGSDLRRR